MILKALRVPILLSLVPEWNGSHEEASLEREIMIQSARPVGDTKFIRNVFRKNVHIIVWTGKGLDSPLESRLERGYLLWN